MAFVRKRTSKSRIETGPLVESLLKYQIKSSLINNIHIVHPICKPICLASSSFDSSSYIMSQLPIIQIILYLGPHPTKIIDSYHKHLPFLILSLKYSFSLFMLPYLELYKEHKKKNRRLTKKIKNLHSHLQFLLLCLDSQSRKLWYSNECSSNGKESSHPQIKFYNYFSNINFFLLFYSFKKK